jgi:hypothetical protein
MDDFNLDVLDFEFDFVLGIDVFFCGGINPPCFFFVLE